MSLEQIPYLSPAEAEAMLNGPALQPPPGVTPKYTDRSTALEVLYVACGLVLVVATTAAALRAYSRICIVKKVQIEDYLALGALCAFIAYVGGIIAFMRSIGAFVHMWNVQLKEVETVNYLIYICTVLNEVVFLLIKPCILIEWCRIFCPNKRTYFYYTCWGLITINVLWYIAVILLANLECFPQAKIWDKTIVGGRCLDPIQVKLIWVYNAAVNLGLDIIILALPQKVIWNLKLNRKKKVGLSMIFAFGLVSVFCAAMRLYKTITFIYSTDVTFTISEYGLWCITEIFCTFLVFCLPAVPKIIIESKPMARIASFFDLKSSKNTSQPLSNSRWPSQQLGPSSKSGYAKGSGTYGTNSVTQSVSHSVSHFRSKATGGSGNNSGRHDGHTSHLDLDDFDDGSSGHSLQQLGQLGGSSASGRHHTRSESQEELRQQERERDRIITRTTEFVTSEEYITTPQDRDEAMRTKLGISRL